MHVVVVRRTVSWFISEARAPRDWTRVELRRKDCVVLDVWTSADAVGIRVAIGIIASAFLVRTKIKQENKMERPDKTKEKMTRMDPCSDGRGKNPMFCNSNLSAADL